MSKERGIADVTLPGDPEWAEARRRLRVVRRLAMSNGSVNSNFKVTPFSDNAAT